MGGSYVLAALVFVVSIGASVFLGWHERGKQADAERRAYLAEASEKIAQAEKRAAETSERVVIRYKDRVQVIRQVPEEVAHDIQIIADSKCVLPAEWVRVHNAAAGVPSEAAAGADDASAAVSCALAAEIVATNYRAARENAEQLTALQEWARALASP